MTRILDTVYRIRYVDGVRSDEPNPRYLGDDMTKPRWDETECSNCGDCYADGVNDEGLCGGCANEAEGLCWCGRQVYAGFNQCDECAADEHADALFHADR